LSQDWLLDLADALAARVPTGAKIADACPRFVRQVFPDAA
jgi:hypothetical protein